MRGPHVLEDNDLVAVPGLDTAQEAQRDVAELVAEEHAVGDDRMARWNHHDVTALLPRPALHGVGEMPGVVAILAPVRRVCPAGTEASRLVLNTRARSRRGAGAQREDTRQCNERCVERAFSHRLLLS